MIDNYIVNINKEITYLHFDLEIINDFTKKLKFYNPEIEIEPLQKFWYNINNSKIIKKNANNIEIVLSQNNEKIIKSINTLDKLVNDIVKEKNISCINNKSIIDKKNYPSIMLLYFDEFTKFYNNDNNEINYHELKIDTKINIFIEFDCVTINNNKCNKKWRILQLKENKTFNNNFNFFNSNSITMSIISNIPPAPILPVYNQNQAQIYPQEIIKPKIDIPVIKQEYSRSMSMSMINVNDIQNVLGKLKKRPDIIHEEKKVLPFLADLCSMKDKLKKTPVKENDYKILFSDLIEKYKDLSHFEI